MSGDTNLYRPPFKSWVKACIGLRYMQDGCEKCVEDEIKYQHSTIVAKVESRSRTPGYKYDCSACTIDNLRPIHRKENCPYTKKKCLCARECSPTRRHCPQYSACSRFHDYVWDEYQEGSCPTFLNSNVELWSTNFWEFGKCFIQTQGYKAVTSAANTDAAGLLSICIHNRTLWNMFGQSQIIKDARNTRNAILHSGRLDVSKEKLEEYLDSMVKMLSLPKLQNDDNAKRAIENIEKLKTENLEITTEDELTARKSALKAVSKKISEIIEKLDETENNADQAKDESNKDDITNVDQLHAELATLTVVQSEHHGRIEGYIRELQTKVTGIQESIKMHQEDLKAIVNGLDINHSLLKEIQETQVVQGLTITEIKDDVKQVLGQFIEMRNNGMANGIPIPVIRLVLLTRNISNNKERVLGEVIVEVGGHVKGKAILKDAQWAPIKQMAEDCLQKMTIDHGEDQRDIFEVKNECIAIYVQCWTLQSLIHLCEQCMSGKLTEFFRPLEEEIKRRLPHYSDLELEVAIFEKDLTRCMDVFVGRVKRKLMSEHAGVQMAIVTLPNGLDVRPRHSLNNETHQDELCGGDETNSNLKEIGTDLDMTKVHDETIDAEKVKTVIETVFVSQDEEVLLTKKESGDIAMRAEEFENESATSCKEIDLRKEDSESGDIAMCEEKSGHDIEAYNQGTHLSGRTEGNTNTHSATVLTKLNGTECDETEVYNKIIDAHKDEEVIENASDNDIATSNQKRDLSGRKKDVTCLLCSLAFAKKEDFKLHLADPSHTLRLIPPLRQSSRFREPPKGPAEYKLCPRFEKHPRCSVCCTDAHGKDELDEWNALRREHIDNINVIGVNLETPEMEKVTANFPPFDLPDTVESVQYATINQTSDLNICLPKKPLTHKWVFEIQSDVFLQRVKLANDSAINVFSVYRVYDKTEDTIVYPSSLEWENKNKSRKRDSFQYEIEVAFSAEVYGNFHERVIFDFGHTPAVCKKLTVRTTQNTKNKTPKHSQSKDQHTRWQAKDVKVVEFQLRNQEERQLLEEYSIDKFDEGTYPSTPSPTKRDYTNLKRAMEISSPEIFSKTDDEKTDSKTSNTGEDYEQTHGVNRPTLSEYKRRMHKLLYFEEKTQLSVISKFDGKRKLTFKNELPPVIETCSEAYYATNGALFTNIELKDELSEDTTAGRLVLRNSDSVWLTPVGSRKIPEKVYEAGVHHRQRNFLDFELSPVCVSELGLETKQTRNFEVQLQLNRIRLCEMHKAVDELQNLEIVFPNSVSSCDVDASITDNDHFQNDLSLKTCNDNQYIAIIKAASVPKKLSPPLLLVGPFGTGKTFTLAQAAKVVIQQDGTRVLICTHSNSEADIYVEDYFHPYCKDNHPEAKPLRIYYQHRWPNTVSKTVRQYCLQEGHSFRKPRREDILRHRIVVTTFSTAKMLTEFPEDLFTHIYLDEAAQVLECEALIPLSKATQSTRVVLAGDQMQMSPEIYSLEGKKEGFQKSLLERLNDLYPDDCGYKVMLHENYRTHDVILKFTSNLFYDYKLSCAMPQEGHPELYPLAFYTVLGEDEPCGLKEGFCNKAEVCEVVDQVALLKEKWPSKHWGEFSSKSIGVVAPYRMQVKLIRDGLRKINIKDVSVERVANVQGKEFRVVIMSTVRTKETCTEGYEETDQIDFGFLSNVKFLTTVITRAKSLVMTIGDPITLCLVGQCRKVWETYLNDCNTHGSFYGLKWEQYLKMRNIELTTLNPMADEFYPKVTPASVEEAKNENKAEPKSSTKSSHVTFEKEQFRTSELPNTKEETSIPINGTLLDSAKSGVSQSALEIEHADNCLDATKTVEALTHHDSHLNADSCKSLHQSDGQKENVSMTGTSTVPSFKYIYEKEDNPSAYQGSMKYHCPSIVSLGESIETGYGSGIGIESDDISPELKQCISTDTHKVDDHPVKMLTVDSISPESKSDETGKSSKNSRKIKTKRPQPEVTEIKQQPVFEPEVASCTEENLHSKQKIYNIEQERIGQGKGARKKKGKLQSTETVSPLKEIAEIPDWRKLAMPKANFESRFKEPVLSKTEQADSKNKEEAIRISNYFELSSKNKPNESENDLSFPRAEKHTSNKTSAGKDETKTTTGKKKTKRPKFVSLHEFYKAPQTERTLRPPAWVNPAPADVPNWESVWDPEPYSFEDERPYRPVNTGLSFADATKSAPARHQGILTPVTYTEERSLASYLWPEQDQVYMNRGPSQGNNHNYSSLLYNQSIGPSRGPSSGYGVFGRRK
ncbi:uncharacterized protein LOC128222086 isoform X3 [Mya arenaria]|uniref:uncharacterized protein LOC128222086 isoform X3 n=1 Tax=Mya arenaria TaxID=6604 RepID=UPI0022E5BA2B|nr:uncharacterized protein LOC128222086 isoform X3 [Mya arenaria]